MNRYVVQRISVQIRPLVQLACFQSWTIEPAGAGRGQSDWCSRDAADEALGPSQGAGIGSMPYAAALPGQLREFRTLR